MHWSWTRQSTTSTAYLLVRRAAHRNQQTPGGGPVTSEVLPKGNLSHQWHVHRSATKSNLSGRTFWWQLQLEVRCVRGLVTPRKRARERFKVHRAAGSLSHQKTFFMQLCRTVSVEHGPTEHLPDASPLLTGAASIGNSSNANRLGLAVASMSRSCSH